MTPEQLAVKSSYNKQWKRDNPDKVRQHQLKLAESRRVNGRGDRTREWRANHLRRTYNLTEEQYDVMLADQGGVCGICGREPQLHRLSVDHDHSCCPGNTSCGKCVRGLLCTSCNPRLYALESGWRGLAEAYLANHDAP